jgi:PadR family transcriptional regulator PadR
MGPLSQNEILILATLGASERYGRDITEEIARITDDRYKISLGGLYTTLHRMEKKKLVSGRWGDQRADHPEAQRRYYRITALGQRVLKEAGRTLMPALRLVPGLRRVGAS